MTENAFGGNAASKSAPAGSTEAAGGQAHHKTAAAQVAAHALDTGGESTGSGASALAPDESTSQAKKKAKAKQSRRGTIISQNQKTKFNKHRDKS